MVDVALRWDEPLTVDYLATITDESNRYELADGVLLVTPAPRSMHQRVVARLIAVLMAAKSPEHDVMPAPFDWRISPVTQFQPDIIVAWRVNVGEERLEVAPLLAVEVLSPSTRRRDLVLKRDAYAAAGVPAYWIVEPDEPGLVALRLSPEGEYDEEASVTGAEPFDATFPVPVRVVPADLQG